MKPLHQYLMSMPKPEREDYARRAGTTLNYLVKAISAGHRLGGVLVRGLDEASGGVVSKHELRPDIFGPPPSACPVCEQPVQKTGEQRRDVSSTTVSHSLPKNVTGSSFKSGRSA